MGDPAAATRIALAMRRHRLRIRTVAISFAAATRSAHRDMVVGPAERDALIETWRAWCMRVLDDYARQTAELAALAGDEEEPERVALAASLDEAYRTVREA